MQVPAPAETGGCGKGIAFRRMNVAEKVVSPAGATKGAFRLFNGFIGSPSGPWQGDRPFFPPDSWGTGSTFDTLKG